MSDEAMSQAKVKKTDPNRKHIIRIAVILGLAGLSVWVWEDFLEDRVIAKRFGVVKEGQIYRSGQISAALIKKILQKHDIDVIVDLTHEKPGDPDQMAELEAAAELGVEKCRFPLSGNGTGDVNQYIQALKKLIESEKAGKKVLVHCAAGSQRAGGTIALYRLLHLGQVPSVILKEMIKYDWDPQDDGDLIDYLHANTPEIKSRLIELGVLDGKQ